MADCSENQCLGMEVLFLGTEVPKKSRFRDKLCMSANLLLVFVVKKTL